jgi:hypothetical protein
LNPITTDESLDGISALTRTNTQTRRLGYLKQICKFLQDEPCPQIEVTNRLEGWAGLNQFHLETHVSNKGIIRRSGRSLGAKRYIELAQDLELVTETSGYLRLTKTGRVLLSIEKDSPSPDIDNPFQLGHEERLLFLYELLLLDNDYLLPILKLTTRCHKQLDIQKQTQAALREHFKIIERRTSSQIVRSQAAERSIALLSWTKPIKYSEHLAVPRLHWLLDLELLDWVTFKERKEFRPSKIGKKLLQGMPNIEGDIFVNRHWCQNDLFTLWAKNLDHKEPWKKLTSTHQKSLIKTYVLKGFSLFRTMEYPRISAYQLVLFTVIRLLFCENVAAGFENIKQALSEYGNSSSDGWVFYWTEMDDDGYVLLPR